MKKMLRYALPCGALLLMAGLLYIPHLHGPTFYDDVYFFSNPGSFSRNFLESWDPAARRWVSYTSLALTWKLWGTAVEPYRLISLLLHGMVACSLYQFIYDLTARSSANNSRLPAFIAAAFFALHPVAVFAAGAIIQRSILMATLFSLWMWIAVWRGITRKQPVWLLLSVFFYYCAVFSKEHAVTAAGVAVLVAWLATAGDWREMKRTLALPIVGWVAVAITVVLTMRGLIGSRYEPILAEMALPQDGLSDGGFFLRSIINQGYLWFKYALLWGLPNENWMAVDLREPYPPVWHAFPWVLGAVAFIGYPLVIAMVYRSMRISRLAVVALLSPWLLFFAQFSAPQYQESFVLYRSYLWAAPGVIGIALLVAKLQPKGQWLALTVGALVLFGLSWSRLQTFSDTFLIWDEAVERLNGHDERHGAYRVYHNRGLAYTRMGVYDRAMNDFDKVIVLNPGYYYVYNDKGYVLYKLNRNEQALEAFQKAIDAKPNYPRPYVGKGLALIALDRREEGLASLSHACELGYGCPLYHEAQNQKEVDKNRMGAAATSKEKR